METDRREADEEAGDADSKRKDSKKGGKGDRAGKGAQKPKDSQVAWVKKAETENSEEAGGERDDRERNPDRKGREKGREKKENWKDRGERGDKKDAWKERRRKPEKPEDSKRDISDNPANGQVLNGGVLLSMLKANPPGVTRYSREELLSIGQLPASKVKPPGLNIIIDKENAASPLLVKAKADKDDYEEDAGARRARPARPAPAGARRPDSEEEDDGDKRRGRKGQSGWTDRTDRWKEEERPQRPTKVEEPQWDMPDVAAGNEGSLLEFTLGDIRKAEKSISGGMSMKDYKASLRASGGPSLDVADNSKERDDFFQADAGGEGSSLFVEEDEDVSRASRGFGKWFGRGSGIEAAVEEEENESPWDMPAVPAVRARPMVPSGSPALTAARPPSSRLLDSPSAPAGLGSVEKLLEEPEIRRDESSASNVAGRSILSMLGRPDLGADSGHEVAAAVPSAAAAAAAANLDKKGKLSVAELFHLAQGQELPPIPPMTGARGDGDGESAEKKAQREVLKMASQFMWAAAAKTHPGMPPGSRVPGYEQPAASPFGVVPPSVVAGRGAPGASGSAGRGSLPMGGRGQNDQFFSAEAYHQAMMDVGRGFGMAGPAGYPPFGPRGVPGFSSQQYGAYPPFAHMPQAAGFGAGAVQGYSGQLPMGLQAGAYSRLPGAVTSEGLAAPRPKASTSVLGLGSSLGNASTLGAGLGLPNATQSAAGAAGLEAPRLAADRPAADEGTEEDAGCSQS